MTHTPTHTCTYAWVYVSLPTYAECREFQSTHLLPACVTVRNHDGKLIILECFEKDPHRTIAILCGDLPISESGMERPEHWQGWDSWSKLVSETCDECLEVVKAILRKYREHVRVLAFSRDRYGRIVFDIATPKCRAAIQETLLFYKRFRLEDKPVHRSNTSVVYFATDCGEAACAAEERRVALKFMRERDHFEREVAVYGRLRQQEAKRYFVCMLGQYDGDKDSAFAECAEACGFGRYCVVMDRADRSDEYSVCVCLRVCT
jgi:hypothetical protein